MELYAIVSPCRTHNPIPIRLKGAFVLAREENYQLFCQWTSGIKQAHWTKAVRRFIVTKTVHFAFFPLPVFCFVRWQHNMCEEASSAWGNIAFIIKYKGVLVTFPLRVYSNELRTEELSSFALSPFFAKHTHTHKYLFASFFLALLFVTLLLCDGLFFQLSVCHCLDCKQNMLPAHTHNDIYITSLNT